MESGDLVNAGQLGIWIFVITVGIYRLFKGGSKLHPKLQSFLRSNLLIWSLVLFGLIAYAPDGYDWLSSKLGWTRFQVNQSAYMPGNSMTLGVIQGQAFENQDVPLDGYIYDNCTFRNVCFLYDGGAYQLQNAKIKGPVMICSRNENITNHSNLAMALGQFKRGVTFKRKTVVPLKQ
jgi:hypothetical protein